MSTHVHSEQQPCDPAECPGSEEWGSAPAPVEPGLYLARKNKSFRWWHIVVDIRGTAPYLSYRAWDLSGTYEDGETSHGGEPDLLFGPRIEAEPPRWSNK